MRNYSSWVRLEVSVSSRLVLSGEVSFERISLQNKKIVSQIAMMERIECNTN